MDKPTQMKGLLSKLLCCSDQHAGMPAFTCDELGMRRGSTYGMAAQHIAAPIERGEDPSAGVKAKRAARVQVIMRLILRCPPERREREFQASMRRIKLRLVDGGLSKGQTPRVDLPTS